MVARVNSFSTLAATLVVGLLGATLAAKAADTSPIIAGNTAFALELYGKLREQPGNLFLSPYNISTALAMTYGGARGETEKQICTSTSRRTNCTSALARCRRD